jgi:cell division protein FtsQ
MAGGGRTERGSRRRAAVAGAVVPLSRHTNGDRLDLARVVPSGRSLVVAFGLLIAVFGAYWGARATSVFAVDRVVVRGAPPDVVREVQAVTKATVGTSLLSIDTDEVAARVRVLPAVIAASVDRAFPHTLVVKVAAERPVAVARRGPRAWLVTGSNRVIRASEPDAEPGLPQIWLPRRVSVAIGAMLPATYEPATRALAGLRDVHLAGRVKNIRTNGDELTLVLENGREVLLGDPTDVLLKVAVAAQILPHLTAEELYLDVSVPERPVASAYPQPSG